jgi:hypothetical protein
VRPFYLPGRRSATSSAQRVLTRWLADSPASDSTPTKASENAIKLVFSGNFAAFIRFQLTMLGL